MLCLYVRASSAPMSFGVADGLAHGVFEVARAGFGIGAAEDVNEEVAARLLRQELPAAAGLRVVSEIVLERGRRIELALHGGGEKLDGLIEPAQAGGFSFDAADEIVELVACRW